MIHVVVVHSRSRVYGPSAGRSMILAERFLGFL